VTHEIRDADAEAAAGPVSREWHSHEGERFRGNAVAPFETWETNGRGFDTVVSGQAWHWADPVAGAAKAAAALRPGGRFAVFWNVFQPPAELGQAFAETYRLALSDLLADLPSGLWDRPLLGIYETMGAKAADGMRQTGAFGPPEQWYFEWERPYTRDEWLEQVPTFGGFSRSRRTKGRRSWPPRWPPRRPVSNSHA